MRVSRHVRRRRKKRRRKNKVKGGEETTRAGSGWAGLPHLPRTLFCFSAVQRGKFRQAGCPQHQAMVRGAVCGRQSGSMSYFENEKTWRWYFSLSSWSLCFALQQPLHGQQCDAAASFDCNSKERAGPHHHRTLDTSTSVHWNIPDAGRGSGCWLAKCKLW